MAERGAVGRLLHAFANAVLARTLPTVREWLAARLGPGASVEAMELDGARVRLIGARLPIGPTAVLEVERASFAANAGEGPPIVLERLEGRLVVPDAGGLPRFVAPLTLEGRPPPTGAEWVHGLLTVTGAHWRASPGRDEQAPLSGTATVSVTSDGWSLEDGEARAAEARITLAGAGRIDDPGRGLERARLEAHDARVGHFVDAMAALAGRAPAIPVPLPWTGRCDALVEVEGDATRARLDVRTAGSRLRVEADLGGGRVHGARVEGSLAIADLVPAPLAASLAASAPVACAGEIAGPFDALSGEVRLACDRLAAPVLRESARLDVRVVLEGAAGARARGELAFERGVGTLGVLAAIDPSGALDGSVSGDLDPAVIDPRAGVLVGERVGVTGRIGGSLRAPELDVRGRSERITFARGGGTLALEEVIADARWHDGAHLDVGARLGSGTVQLDPLARRASGARVDAGAVVALARARGIAWLRLASEPAPRGRFALPDDAEIDFELGLEGGAVAGALTVATPRSRVSIDPLRVAADGRWDGSMVRGRLAADDALRAGLFPSALRPLPQGLATMELGVSGAGAGASVEGRITTASLAWRLLEGAPPVELVAAACDLRVDGEAVTLRGLEGRVFGGPIALDLRVAYPDAGGRARLPTGRLVLDGAREGFGPWLRQLLGRSRLPAGLALDVELESDADGRLRGPIVLSSKESRLTLALVLDAAGRVEGSVLGGEVSLSDLYELFERGGPSIVGKGNLELSATLEGTWDAPEAAVKAFCEQPRLMIAWGKGERVSLDRVLARGRLSRDRLVWSELVVDGYGGRLRSQGLAGWGEGFRGLQAKVELDDVIVGELPRGGGRRVGEHLGGRLNGTLTLRRKPGEALAGKGQLFVEHPVLPMLNLAEPALARYGLKPPPIAGTEPLMADVRGGPEGWLLKGLSGAVRGARIDGDLALRADGQVLGALEVSLETAYLRSSPMLRVPATMVGDLRIPVRVRGPLGAPAIEADFVATLDHLVAKSRLGRGLQSAVDAVMDRVGGERERQAPADEIERMSDQALILRLARGVGDEDRQIELLIERGLTPTEIADRIEAARRR